MSKMIGKSIKIKYLLSMIVISILITFFAIPKIEAYYQKELNVNIPFTTASYSDLTLSLDKTSYPSGNNSATVLLTVTNPNSYAVSYTLSFSNTTATYTIDGLAGTTYVVNANSNKTNTIAINGATGTSITITVNTVLPYSASKTIVASFDNVNPTVEVTTTNNVAASQTATLKCSDNVGVTAYYWGTTEPTSVSNITTTTTADLNSLKSTSGLAKTVSGAGTYWLGCRDAAGNFSKTSIVYQKVTLSMSNGTVSSSSIVAKNGNSVSLPTPTANNGYTNAGYWYSSNAYSTSVGAYGSNYTVSSTTTIYSRATDVTAPTVSFNPNTSSSYAKTGSVTVTVADAGSKVKANQTIKYRWQTGTICSTTASDYSNTVALSNTSEAAASTTATVPASGLTGTYYLCIYSGIQDVAGNNSVITKSGSFLFDNTAPSSCSWGNWSTSYIKSGGTATITLTCADADSGITMDLSTSDVTVSGTNLGTVTNVTKGGSNASRTYTFTLTAGTISDTATVSIAANKVHDALGNNYAVAQTSSSIIIDTTAPTLAVSVTNGTTYAKSKTATITISDTDGSGFANTAQTIRYAWSTSEITTCNATSMPNTTTITPTAGSFDATGTITINSGTGAGQLYICNASAISDRAGNSLAASQIYSADMYLDNTPPTINLPTSPLYVIKGSTVAFTQYASADDSHSGLASYTANYTNASSMNLGSYTLTYTATDSVGNTGTSNITLVIYTRIDCNTSGITTDPTNSARCIFRGADPNNYIKFNATYDGLTASGGTLFRIIGRETDGRIKIVHSGVLETRAIHSSETYTWGDSTLKAYLNGTQSGDYYESLNSNAKNHIQQSQFNIGQMNYYNQSSNTIAQTVTAENATKDTASYVGIPNVYDHLLASTNCTSTTKWTTITSKTNGNFPCDVDNWMVYTTEGAEEWFITPYSSIRARRWISPACTSNQISGCSSANAGSIQYTIPTSVRDIRPVVYLKDTVIIIGGTGTADDPYILDPTKFISATSPATCTVTTTSGYDTSKTLTITATLNGATLDTNGYSWDNSTWGSTNTQSVSAAGTYWGYIKDIDARTNSCSIVITSRTEYRYRDCASNHLGFSDWVSRGWHWDSSCPNISKSVAESQGLLYYYTSAICQGDDCQDYLKCWEYTRTRTCSWGDEQWSSWSTTAQTASSIKQVQTRTTYSP